MSASAADAIGIGARAIERPSAITSHPTVAFTANIPESNFRYTQPFKVPEIRPRNRQLSFNTAVTRTKSWKILPRLSIDLRQRAKAANAAALVAMLLPDLPVRFWIHGLDDCIGRVAIPGPA
jgi:hypothetical protein